MYLMGVKMEKRMFSGGQRVECQDGRNRWWGGGGSARSWGIGNSMVVGSHNARHDLV